MPMGDLPIRHTGYSEFHVEGDLVLAGKDRLYMFFRNALPLLKLLEAEGLRVVFLNPCPGTCKKAAARLTTTRRTDSTRGSRPAYAKASWRPVVISKISCS
jgi:hypothetical protein